MPNRFATGKFAISECDRCGFRFALKKLRKVIIKTRPTSFLVCPTCWEQDHPQLQLGMYPVDDPQALRNPRPDQSYVQSGLNALGAPGEGSRAIQWGWAPVGFNNPLGLQGLPSTLVAYTELGAVTVQIGV